MRVPSFLDTDSSFEFLIYRIVLLSFSFMWPVAQKTLLWLATCPKCKLQVLCESCDHIHSSHNSLLLSIHFSLIDVIISKCNHYVENLKPRDIYSSYNLNHINLNVRKLLRVYLYSHNFHFFFNSYLLKFI